ncbi:MAG: L,D-transpeptidase family protein [Verrucomicrobiaceae bacterium]|nr:L,D-transpeptidase family protein [Verrucomicrobiaceae bacterium]
MQSRPLNTLTALVIPVVIGTGLCALFVQLLKGHELFQPPAVAVAPPIIQTALAAGEVRRAIPQPEEAPTRLSTAPQADLEKAAKKQSAPNTPPKVTVQPLEPAHSTATHNNQANAKKWPVNYGSLLQHGRPILDPITDYWSHLWPRTDALPSIYQAVLCYDSERLTRLASMGIQPDERTLFGDTALCLAVRMAQEDCIRALWLTGAKMDAPGRENQAPILLASIRRGVNILQALLDAGVNPNTRSTAPVSRELIERCSIKDLRNTFENDNGVTPLMCCAARGDVEGAVTLMRAGASANVYTSRRHRYPINFAATQGYLFLMRVLLGRDPEAEPDTLVTVDLSTQRAWVTKQGRVVATTSVSTGREGYRTPAGRYVITDKHRSHTSTLYHVEMPWFMRLNCSAIGLHSGVVTGRPASHGCIRLPYSKAKLFYSLTGVGDEVEILH